MGSNTQRKRYARNNENHYPTMPRIRDDHQTHLHSFVRFDIEVETKDESQRIKAAHVP